MESAISHGRYTVRERNMEKGTERILLLRRFGCNFLYCNADAGIDSCQAMEVSRIVDSETYERPDWCPLRELPEKMEVCGKYPQPGKPIPSYRFGWNACLDEILKTDGMRKE